MGEPISRIGEAACHVPRYGIGHSGSSPNLARAHLLSLENGSVGEIPPEEAEQDIALMDARDDIHGKRLDPLKVEGARAEEIG